MFIASGKKFSSAARTSGRAKPALFCFVLFFLAREFSHYVTVAASYSARDFFSVALLLHFTNKW
jgi:hypothetical protein